MPLYTSFTPRSLGFPKYAYSGVVAIKVDYTEACDAFIKTFLEESHELVPVDTGRLKKSLKANKNANYKCVAKTNCEYAQYVEYGTIYQSPQPYFEPAVDVAIDEFVELAWEAYEEAQEKADAIAMSLAAGG